MANNLVKDDAAECLDMAHRRLIEGRGDHAESRQALFQEGRAPVTKVTEPDEGRVLIHKQEGGEFRPR